MKTTIQGISITYDRSAFRRYTIAFEEQTMIQNNKPTFNELVDFKYRGHSYPMSYETFNKYILITDLEMGTYFEYGGSLCKVIYHNESMTDYTHVATGIGYTIGNTYTVKKIKKYSL